MLNDFWVSKKGTHDVRSQFWESAKAEHDLLNHFWEQKLVAHDVRGDFSGPENVGQAEQILYRNSDPTSSDERAGRIHPETLR